MKQLLPLFVVLAVYGYAEVKASSVISDLENKSHNEDAKLTVRQLITKYGYRGETHMVTTETGYILGLHRITGPKSHARPEGKQPVLVLHPLLGSSCDFIITGPGRALDGPWHGITLIRITIVSCVVNTGYVLADEGYDVWLGNVRGNSFSRKHKEYTTLDKEYWQFSWHESGVEDLPAMIDYILEETKREQLLYVGHSQGTTAFWVMASERPEYQDKVKAMIALAPVAYLTHMRSPLYHVLAKYGNNLEMLATLLGYYEFEPAGKLLQEIKAIMCDDESWSQPICTNTIFFIAGDGSDQLDTTMLPAILAHIPAGGSVKQVLHFLQVLKARRFQQYDHGPIRNLVKYKQLRPPAYDLSRINVPVYLHYSLNDWLSHPKDVYRLNKELGNSIGSFRVAHKNFTHLDFLWAKDSRKFIYDKVVAQLKIYDD